MKSDKMNVKKGGVPMTLAGRKSLEAMAECGDGQACLDLYEAYTKETDQQSARRWLDMALDINYPSAQVVEGIAKLEEGAVEEGIEYLKLAAANGNAKAMFVLGEYYLDNISHVHTETIDIERGLQYLNDAAMAGNCQAQILLGKNCYSGKWSRPCPWMAKWWLEKAARQGDAHACYLLDELLLVRNNVQ